MTSSIYALPVSPKTSFPLGTGTLLLDQNIVITPEMVSPGGGGVLRLYFSITFDMMVGDIRIVMATSKIFLNSDNNKEIISDGYYTFDVEVEANDEINLDMSGLNAANQIFGINFIRAHLIQFGA